MLTGCVLLRLAGSVARRGRTGVNSGEDDSQNGLKRSWRILAGQAGGQRQFGVDERGKGRLNFKMKSPKDAGDNLKSTEFVSSEKVLFDVPVYRLSKAEYESQQNIFIQRELKKSGGKYAEEAYRRNPEMKTDLESHLWKVYGGCWLFNEIIGFIRLYFYFSEVRGEYWSTYVKRNVRTRRKVFRSLGDYFGFGERIPQGSSNVEICKRIEMFLSCVQKGNEFKRRYVDASVLKNIEQHINWNRLLEEQFVREQSEPCQPTQTK